MAQTRVVSATIEFVVEEEPGDIQALDLIRSLAGHDIQVDRKRIGVGIRAVRGETVVGVEED